MQNSLPLLKRKLRNFRTLNKVGDAQLNRSMGALSEVQQQKQTLNERLQETNKVLETSATYYQQTGDVLVPELMGNLSLYVNELVLERDQQQQRLERLNQDADEKLKAVFKLKKTNQVVQKKMQIAQQQMADLYFKHMDEEIADVLQIKRED